MRHLILVAGSAVLLAACSESQAQEGPSVSRAFDVGAFEGIEVAGPFDVMVTTGKPVAVSVEAPQRLIDAMEVTVRDNRLVIRPKRSGWFGGMQWRGRPAKVRVSVPSLASAAIAGSGDIVIDRVQGERFDGSVAGSGDLRLGQAAVRDLKLSIAGSGEVQAAGRAERASYAIAGSGDLDASGLTATSAKAEIAGSGNIRARVTGEAKASIAGSGDIDISGGARCQQSKQGSGNIRCS